MRRLDEPDLIRFTTSWHIDLIAINNCMARIIPDRSSFIEPPSNISGRVLSRDNRMALPLSSHPIVHLRKATIVIAVIGIVLCCLSSSNYYYDGGTLAASVIFLALSALLCTTDLISYATKKVEHPDEDPKWPLRRWIIVDVIMAVVLQFIFWCAIIGLADFYGYGTNIVGAYGALADFLCS